MDVRQPRLILLQLYPTIRNILFLLISQMPFRPSQPSVFLQLKSWLLNTLKSLSTILCTEHFVSKLIPLTFLHITTDLKEEEQLEDRRNVGENSCNSGDGTDQTVQSLMFMMMMKNFPPLNPLNPELNPICCLLALLGANHFLHVSRIKVKSITLRVLMSYIYGAPILDVSRSHTTTQHSR